MIHIVSGERMPVTTEYWQIYSLLITWITAYWLNLAEQCHASSLQQVFTGHKPMKLYLYAVQLCMCSFISIMKTSLIWRPQQLPLLFKLRLKIFTIGTHNGTSSQPVIFPQSILLLIDRWSAVQILGIYCCEKPTATEKEWMLKLQESVKTDNVDFCGNLVCLWEMAIRNAGGWMLPVKPCWIVDLLDCVTRKIFYAPFLVL